jgi:hypothetical protein
MGQPFLKQANRALLRAIETPPDSGLEPRIDRLAARLWMVTEREGYAPDPGEVCRLDQKLARLATQTTEERAEYIEDARELVRAYLVSLNPSF